MKGTSSKLAAIIDYMQQEIDERSLIHDVYIYEYDNDIERMKAEARLQEAQDIFYSISEICDI